MASSENDNIQKVQSTTHQRQDEMPSESSNQECFYQDDAQCPCYMCTNHGIEAKPAPSDDGGSGVEFPIRSFWRIAKTQNDIESPMEGNSKGFHYRLLLHPRGTAGTDSESTHLSVFVEAVVQDWYPEYWVFPNVRFELTVVNFKDPKQSVTSWAHWSFSSDATSRGWQKMIMHSKLTKSAGFMDDEGTVLIRGKAEPPYMCLWSKGQPYQPQMMWEYIPDRAQRETCSDICKKEREDRLNNLHISDSEHDKDEPDLLNKYKKGTNTYTNNSINGTEDRDSKDKDDHLRKDKENLDLDYLNKYQDEADLDQEYIGDRLLLKCLDSVVPAISPTLDSDFMAMMVHILYHLREFRRSVLMWNHEFDSEVTEETSIILALQKVFAYMYLYPLAVSCRTYKLSSVDNPDISKYYLYELVPKLTNKNKDLNKLNNYINENIDDRNERLRQLRERRDNKEYRDNRENRDSKDKDNQLRQDKTRRRDRESDKKEEGQENHNNYNYDNPTINCCSFDGGRFEWELENLETSLNSSNKRPMNTFVNNNSYKLVPGSLSHSIADRPDVFSKLLPPPPNIKPVLKAMHMTDLQTLEPQDQLVSIHSEMFTMLLRDLASAKKLLKQRRLKDNENNKDNKNRDLSEGLEKLKEKDNEKSIPLYLRDQTMLEGMCKYLFSGSPENETLFRSPSVDDISTIYIRCKHSNSLQKALEASPKTMARYPQVLFFYLYPAKNAKKGELFDVPMRLNCTCIKSTVNYDSRSDDSRNTNNYDEYGNFECSEDDDDTFQEFDNVAEKEHNSTRCYSLYALIIKEGDLRYDGVGKGVNSFNTLLLRPEEEGPWYRMSEGKVEKLSNKMDFSEWKCHRDFFCAAAVYLSEDYLDMLGLGEVDLSGNLKEWNPNLYYSTLSELGVTEQDILAAVKYKMKKYKERNNRDNKETGDSKDKDNQLREDKENLDKRDEHEHIGDTLLLDGLEELRLFSELSEEEVVDLDNKETRDSKDKDNQLRQDKMGNKSRYNNNINWIKEYLHMRRVGFSHPKLSSCCETHGYNPLMLMNLDERERKFKYEVDISNRDIMRRINRLKTIAPFVNWLFNASKENTYLLNGINPPTDGKLLVNFLQKRERIFEEEFRHLISELFFREISENLARNNIYSWNGEVCSCGCNCRTCVEKPALLLTENGRFPGEDLKMMLSEPATILFRNIQILRCHLEYFSKDCRNMTLQLQENRNNKTGDEQKVAHEVQPIQHLLEGSQLQMQYPQLLSNLQHSGSGSLSIKNSDELTSHKLKYEMDSHTTLQHILNPHRFETGGKIAEIRDFKSTSERSALFLIECIWDACIRYTLDCRTIIFLKACSDEGLTKSSSGLTSNIKNPLVTPGGQCRDLFVFDSNMGSSNDLLEHEETNQFDSKYDLKVQDELNIMHYYNKKYKLPSVSEMRNYLRRSRVLVYGLIRPHELLRSYLMHKYKVNIVKELEQMGYNIIWNEDAFNHKANLSDLSESELKMYGITNMVPNVAYGIGHDLCNIYEKLLTKMLVHMQDVDKEVYPNCFDYVYTVADVSKIVEAIRIECDKTLNVCKTLMSSGITSGTGLTGKNTGLKGQLDHNKLHQEYLDKDNQSFGTMSKTLDSNYQDNNSGKLSTSNLFNKSGGLNELNEKCGNSCGLVANNKHVCSQDGCVCLGHECRYNFGYVGFMLPFWVTNQMADLELFTNSQLQVYNESLIEDLSELCLKSDDKKKKKVKPRKQSFEKATCIIPPLDVKLKNIEFDQVKAYQSDSIIFLNPSNVARFYYKRESSLENHKFTQMLSNTNPYKHGLNTSLGYLTLLNLSAQTSTHLTDSQLKGLNDNLENLELFDKKYMQHEQLLENKDKLDLDYLDKYHDKETRDSKDKDNQLRQDKMGNKSREKSLSPRLESVESESFKVKHAIEVGIITTHDLFGLEGFSCETKVVPTKRLFVSHKYNGVPTKVLHLYWAIRKLINQQISDEFLNLGSNKTKKKENCICGYDCPNDNECMVKLLWRPCAGDCFMLYALKNDLHSLRLGKKFVYMQPNMDLSYYVNPDKNKGPDITILICGGPSSFYLNGVNTWFPLQDDSEYPLLIFKWMCVDTVDLLCLGAIVCDAKKQLQQYIFEWLVPIIKELGYLSSLESTKETDTSKELNKDEDVDKYQVLEECYIRSVQNVRRWSCAIKKINKRSGDVIITQLKRTVDSPATMRFKESVLFMNSVKELTELEALELLPDPNNFYGDTWTKHEHDKDEPDLVNKLSKKKKRKTTKAAIPSNKKSTFSRRVQPTEEEKLTQPTEDGEEFVKYQEKMSSELIESGDVHIQDVDKEETESELVEESSEKMAETPLDNEESGESEGVEEELDCLDKYQDKEMLKSENEQLLENKDKLDLDYLDDSKLLSEQRYMDTDKQYRLKVDKKEHHYEDEEMDRLLTKLNEYEGKQFDSGFEVSGDDQQGLAVNQTFEELSKLRHMEMLSKEGLLSVDESVYTSEVNYKSLIKSEDFIHRIMDKEDQIGKDKDKLDLDYLDKYHDKEMLKSEQLDVVDKPEKVIGDIGSLVREGEFRTVLDLCPVMGLVNVCEEVYKLFEQEFRKELVYLPNREFQNFGSPDFFPLGDRELLERVNGSNYKMSPNGIGKQELQLNKNLKKLVKLVKMMYTRLSGSEPVREMVNKLYENYGLKASFTLTHLLTDYNPIIPLMDDVLEYFLSDLSKYSHFLFSEKNTYIRSLLEQMVNVAFKNNKVREKSDSSSLFLMYIVSTPKVYLPGLYQPNVSRLGRMNVKNDHLSDRSKEQLRSRTFKQVDSDNLDLEYLDKQDYLDKDLVDDEYGVHKQDELNDFNFVDDSDSRDLDLNVNDKLDDLDQDLVDLDKENELDSSNDLLDTNLSYERDLDKKYELSRRTVREALLYDLDDVDDILSKPLLHWVDDEVEQFERLLLSQLKNWWSTRQVILDKIKSHIHPTNHRDSVVIPINIHTVNKEQHTNKDNKDHRERPRDELDLFDFRILLYFAENYPEISLCFNRDNVTLYFTGRLDKRSFMKTLKESRQFFGSKNTMRSVPNLPIQHTDTSMTNSSLMDMQLTNNQTALLLLSIKYSNFTQNVDSQFLKSVCNYRTFRAFNIPPPPSTSATLQDTV